MTTESDDVLVVGAGVVGITTALALQARGRKVVVLDRTGVAAEASAGNAGAFALSAVVPLATPGIMRKAPKWLLDPTGPLAVPPSYAFKIAPWLYQFWRASRPSRYRAALAAQAALMRMCAPALDRLLIDPDLAALVRQDGDLELYDSAASFERSLTYWRDAEAEGVPIEILRSRDALAERQPGLSPHFEHGVFLNTYPHVRDPKQWVERLAEKFRGGGGRIEIAQVSELRPGPVVVANGAERRAAHIVIAAGAWSRRLARTLGHKIPLETERGYNTTLPAGAFDLRMQVTFSDHGFVASRIGEGVRVGGAVELGGLSLPPNYKRSKAMLAKAKRFLPGLRTEGGVEWMGFRPSLPDSLPVLGPAPGIRGITYAFGHGHLGLTQSAGTAEIVADLVQETGPQLDLSPYRADRF